MRELSVFMVGVVALLLSSCGKISSVMGVDLDTPEAWTSAKELITEKVDASKWKVVRVELAHDLSSGSELENKLFLCTVVLVDEAGTPWTQTLFTQGIVSDLSPYTSEVDASQPLDLAKVSPEEYAKHIDAAKKMIPEQYKFECVASYVLDNTNSETAPSCHFVLHITDKDEKSVSNAGHTTTTFYEVRFEVDKEGQVQMLEE